MGVTTDGEAHEAHLRPMSLRATPTCDRCGASVTSHEIASCEDCRVELRREILRYRIALAAQIELEADRLRQTHREGSGESHAEPRHRDGTLPYGDLSRE